MEPVQHVMGPVQHVMGPVQHVIRPRVKTIFVSFISFDLSSMSFYLSNMSWDLSSISFDPCLNRRCGVAGNFFSRPVLKYLLVGNLKNFTLSIHTYVFGIVCVPFKSRP
ncbi:hypothetical protein TNCV_4093181 [Trichonephila clavipes]|nr:hypothetical protein TNCV_4093181 [Trichonephila clavipes]